MKIDVVVKGFQPSGFELYKGDDVRLSSNSLERVINSAVDALENGDPGNRSIIEDLEELKAIACRLWYAAQNAVFAASNNIVE